MPLRQTSVRKWLPWEDYPISRRSILVQLFCPQNVVAFSKEVTPTTSNLGMDRIDADLYDLCAVAHDAG